MKKYLTKLLVILSATVMIAACGGGSNGAGSGGTTSDTPIITSTSTLASVDQVVTSTEPDGSTIEAAKDEVFVQVRNDISETQLADIKKKIVELSGTVIGSDPDLMVLQIRTVNEVAMIAALTTMPGVITASLNRVCQSTGLTNQEGAALANLERSQSGVRALAAIGTAAVTDTVGFSGGWWMDSINIQKAWSTSTGSASVTIGIVDSGIKAGQKILASSRISRFSADGKAITDDDSAGVPKGQHGLWVSGFAAGFVDDPSNYIDSATATNVRGVNSTSNVVMVDVGQPAKDGTKTILVLTDVLRGIKTAIKKGAKVVNVSIAANTGGCKDDVCKIKRQKEFRLSNIGAVETARKNKSLVVFAAGNDNVKTDNELFADPEDEYSALWKAYSVVVGASTNSPKLTDASSWGGGQGTRMGSVVDLLAPGTDIGFSQDGVDVIVSGHTGSGTSYAAPLVTGVGSLLYSVIGSLLPPETKYLMTSSASETVDTTYSPKKHLDADAAIRSAKLLDGISLSEPPIVKFTSKGQKKSVDLPVTIPTSGVSAMDIMFLTDVSGSYGDDIATMKSQASAILADLGSRGIDIQFGLASFCDFPISPYGGAGDQAFTMMQTLTSDTAKVKSAIDSLSIQYGADGSEAQYEGLYQTASSAGWREGAIHLIVLSTDASFHDSATETAYPGKSSTAALAALAAKKIKVVGLRTGDTGGNLEDVVTKTGGQLFELASDSAGIAKAMADMLEATIASFKVAYQIIGGNEFIESITPAAGFVDVPKGGKVTFTANLTNRKSPSFFKDQAYEIVMWVKANDSIINRIRIPIEIDAKIPGI